MDNKDILIELKRLNEKIDRFEWRLNSTWLSISEVSRYLKISESTLYKMIHSGTIPYKRIGHGSKSKILINRRMLDLSILYGKSKGFTKREREQAEAFI